jgi:hypothetical protein
MSIGTCQISAGSSNPDDKFGYRFAKSSMGLNGLATKNVPLFNGLYISRKMFGAYRQYQSKFQKIYPILEWEKFKD